jgi:hypothetical protein
MGRCFPAGTGDALTLSTPVLSVAAEAGFAVLELAAGSVQAAKIVRMKNAVNLESSFVCMVCFFVIYVGCTAGFGKTQVLRFWRILGWFHSSRWAKSTIFRMAVRIIRKTR